MRPYGRISLISNMLIIRFIKHNGLLRSVPNAEEMTFDFCMLGMTSEDEMGTGQEEDQRHRQLSRAGRRAPVLSMLPEPPARSACAWSSCIVPGVSAGVLPRGLQVGCKTVGQ